MTNFGLRLKLLRDSKKITQQDLATKMDVSRATIAGYEASGKQPDFQKLLWLSNYFSVSTDYLLGRTEKQDIFSHQLISPNETLTKNESELLSIFRRLKDEREQCKLIGRVDEIVDKTLGDFKSENAQSIASKKNVG